MKHFLPVLVYQKIGKAPAHSRLKKQWTTVRALESMLLFLIKRGYHFVTPADLKQLPPKPILLTFMGGYQSFYTEVFPLLKKYNLPATLCIAVDTLGTYNSWQDPYQEPWQNIITTEQLQEIYSQGLVRLATLGITGKNIGAFAPERAQHDWRESIYRLKKLHKMDVCALACWMQSKEESALLSKEFSLPIFTSKQGINFNSPSCLRILQPTWLTRLRLYWHK